MSILPAMGTLSRSVGALGTPSLEIWVVEDNDLLRQNLAELIDQQADMRCGLAVDCCEEFLAALDTDAVPDIVLMDIGLPGKSGIEGVSHIHSVSPASKIVVLTIHGEDDKVFDAICAGASGYLLKPSTPDRIVAALRDVQRGAAPINPYIAHKMLGWFDRLAPHKPLENGYGLTGREQEILQLLVDGLTVNEIAAELTLSPHTIGNHLRNIYRKLHVRSRTRAVAKALREDLV